jgi:uncharacterized protein YyaL (SSP411 family)
MNRLADSLSPYLLQHKDNPVDWFPWGDAAFDRARQTDRPIFLSVGYAACHWCHVMEHESFENEQIAAMLNENFVSIKVDREERPDIDQIYMNAVQVMTGRGGWPMSVFLDHDRQPFYAGTYWPPSQRFGMPGFPQILDALADAWKNRRAEVVKHSAEITGALEKLAVGASAAATAVPDPSVIDDAADKLVAVLDRQHGGFGSAPKFPHATDLAMLLRRGHCSHRQDWIEAAVLTLDRMAGGGIRDHIGGGFARYSVDSQWLVPHFEKMLYDNALLAEVYVRAFQVTGQSRHADVARETLDYLCREMLDESGGFHCSEDADSEGVEGKFYVWTPDEVAEVLGQSRSARFCRIYDITAGGNFEDKNIPHLQRSIDDWAVDLSEDASELRRQLREDCQRLREARNRRVHPGRDDKVLTAWNSLAIRSLAISAAVLDESRYLDVATAAADFILTRMSRPDGRLLHAYRAGQSHLDAYGDDYAYTIEAFIALFEASGDPRWIAQSVRLADLMMAHFEDSQAGGFYYTADDGEALITRNKDWHDGSLVSGNASAVTALLRLSRLCHRADFQAAAERTLRVAEEVMTDQSAACAALLSGLDTYWNGHQQLVVAVEDWESLVAARPQLLGAYRPAATISWVVGKAADSEGIVALNQQRDPIDPRCTLYRCQDFQCAAPICGDEAISWLRDEGDR